MGTSTRNKGQSGHTPLVPSWLEEGGDDGREGQNAGEIKAIPPDGDINRFTGQEGRLLNTYQVVVVTVVQ